MSNNQVALIGGKEVVLQEVRKLFNEQFKIKPTPYGLADLRKDIRRLKSLESMGVVLSKRSVEFKVGSVVHDLGFHDLLKAVALAQFDAGINPFDGPYEGQGFEWINYNRSIILVSVVEAICDHWAKLNKVAVLESVTEQLNPK